MSQEAIYPISNIHSISFKTRLILLPPPFHTSESECCWFFEHCRSHIPLVSSTQRYKIVDNMGFVRDGQSPPCHCLNGKTFKLLYFRYTSPCVKLFMQYPFHLTSQSQSHQLTSCLLSYVDTKEDHSPEFQMTASPGNSNNFIYLTALFSTLLCNNWQLCLPTMRTWQK